MRSLHHLGQYSPCFYYWNWVFSLGPDTRWMGLSPMCQASFWPIFLGSKFPLGQHSPLSLFQNSHDLLSQQSAFDHCLLWLLSLMLSRARFRCQTQCHNNAFCWVHVLNNNLGQRVLQVMPLDTIRTTHLVSVGFVYACANYLRLHPW